MDPSFQPNHLYQKTSPPRREDLERKDQSNHPSSAPTPMRSNGGTDSPTNHPPNEVDYYRNPTELFRWINYRRWDGAMARVRSHPEECETWIVSRHSNDGRILWRHLPLHLICMQSGITDSNLEVKEDSSTEDGPPKVEQEYQAKSHLNQINVLTQDILSAYPEGASLPDDQGMTPLHICLANTAPDTAPNEEIITLLLMTHPEAMDTMDKFNRTPVDILHEKSATVSGMDSILRIMNRIKAMEHKIAHTVKTKHDAVLGNIERGAENERQASKRIIQRLEEELANERYRADEGTHTAGEAKSAIEALRQQVRSLKSEIASTDLDLDQVRKERDELVTKNEILRTDLDKQEGVVATVKRESEIELEEKINLTSSLQSELNTARAMAEAVESQLRSRFTNEQDLTNSISRLEKKLKTENTNHEQKMKKSMQDIDRLTEENTGLQSTVEDLTTKNNDLQTRNKELTKHIGKVLASHSALSTEYDQLLDSNNRYQMSMLESMHMERKSIASSLEKQKQAFEAAMKQQERQMEESRREEVRLKEVLTDERKREKEAMDKIRKDHQEMRALLTRQNFLIAKQDIIPSSLYSSQRKSQIKETNECQEGSQTPESNKENPKSIEHLASEPSSNTSRGKNKRNSQSPDLVGLLEERASGSNARSILQGSSNKYSNLSQRPNSSTSSSSSCDIAVVDGRQIRTPDKSRYHQTRSGTTRPSTTPVHESHHHYQRTDPVSASNRYSKKTTPPAHQSSRYPMTPANSTNNSISHKQHPNSTPIMVGNDKYTPPPSSHQKRLMENSDYLSASSATSGCVERSFSLDDYSHSSSRLNSGETSSVATSSTMGAAATKKVTASPYRGMKVGVKSGLIRIGGTSPTATSGIRKKSGGDGSSSREDRNDLGTSSQQLYSSHREAFLRSRHDE